MRWLPGLLLALFVVAGCNAVFGIGEPTIVDLDAGAAGFDSAVQDGGTVLPPGKCTVTPQAGCGPNETCSPLTETTTTCVPAGGNPEGQACANESSCAAGLLCYDGACHAPCSNLGANCTDASATKCIRFPLDRDAGGGREADLDGGGGAGKIGVCLIACDPTSANACGGVPGGSGPVASCQTLDQQDSTDCRTSTRTNATKCFYLPEIATSACKPGYVCSKETNQPCRRWCKVGSQCANGPCTPLSTPFFVRGVQLSYCPQD
jgi:hypothetical protein